MWCTAAPQVQTECWVGLTAATAAAATLLPPPPSPPPPPPGSLFLVKVRVFLCSMLFSVVKKGSRGAGFAGIQ